MTDSNHTGETTVAIGGRDLVMVFDWRALSAVGTLLKGQDVFAALAGQDPDLLASIVAIGLRRHHPDMTADAVRDASPPLLPTIGATVKALNRAYWGAEAPPPADPRAPAGTTSPAGTSTLPH